MSRAPIVGIDARSLAASPTGVGRYVANLAAAMAALEPGLRLRLYVPRAGGASAPAAPSPVETRRLGAPLVDNVVAWTHLRLPLHLAAHRVDLFHGTFYTLPFLCPAPAVVTIHDITFRLHPEWFTRRARLAFNGFAAASARKARRVLTVSERSRRDIIEAYGVAAAKVTAIPLAPDPRFVPVRDPDLVARTRRRHALGEEYLLHVGSITPRRNIPRLLEAFATLGRRAPHLTLVLAGRVEPPSPPVEVEIQRKGLTDRVKVAGYVPAEDLPALYSGAAAVVYPSLYEGFGLPVLEAMACGVPVMASSTSCFPEVAGDAALLVDPGSTEAMAEGLWSILSDVALRERLVSRGLERAAGFTWEKTARATLQVYREELGLEERPGGRR